MTQQPYQQSQQGRPGQMTAMMRAVMPTGPKVLRIGVVQSGRVVEERIIKQRVDVSVGPSEKSTFTVASDAVPSKFPLFQLVNGEYCVNFLDGMNGRIALPTGISDLSVLKGQARKGPDGSYQIRLTEDSRGKVVIGDTTFLFQFVAPPPVQPKPQLPVAVTRGAGGVDWITTMIAAFSFLVHFFAIGMAYSVDPVVESGASLQRVLESVKRLPPPPAIERKAEKVEEDPNAKKDEKKPEDDGKKKSASKAPKSDAGKGGGKGSVTASQAAAAMKSLFAENQNVTAVLEAKGGAAGTVTRQSWDGSAVSGLGSIAGNAGGITGDSGLLGNPGAGGPVGPIGGGGGGLTGIASRGGGTEGGGAGKKKKTAGPKGGASVSSSVSVGSVSNAQAVVAGMRGYFRMCYQRGLASNPDAQGSISLTIRVGPGGEVQSVGASSSGSLPGSVVGCVRGRAAAASFAPPKGGTAVISVPVSFFKQN